MGGGTTNFVAVWLVVIACLSYCYIISSRIPKGKMRFLSVLPVVSIFTFLPLMFSSVLLEYFCGCYIGWLCNFKLLLFAFGRDETFSTNPSISLLHFIVMNALPITAKRNSFRNREKKEIISHPKETKSTPPFAVNLFILYITIQMYIKYKQQSFLAYRFALPLLYTARMFFSMQVQLVFAAGFAKLLLRKETETQFKNPLASTSVQDFWGRRWNRSASNVLKATIHEPVRSLLTPFFGRRWALYPAILATFLVSGLMHQLLHFYVGHRWPTWEVVWFFIIHGVCVSIEVEVKRRASEIGWKLSPMISVPLTFAFLVVTGSWLCFTELINLGADQREIEEYAASVRYVKETYTSVIGCCNS